VTVFGERVSGVVVQVKPRVVLSGDAQINPTSAPLSLGYTLGHRIAVGLTICGIPVPYGGSVRVTPQQLVSDPVSMTQCYREICFGAECTRLACVSQNIDVGYLESNLQVGLFRLAAFCSPLGFDQPRHR
jgi:hypothetical protein